jgi:hypothetical protein
MLARKMIARHGWWERLCKRWTLIVDRLLTANRLYCMRGEASDNRSPRRL